MKTDPNALKILHAGALRKPIKEIWGAPIEFAVSIPYNSNQKELAQEFIEILTGHRGEEILEANGLIPC